MVNPERGQSNPADELDALFDTHPGGAEMEQLVKRAILKLTSGLQISAAQANALDHFYGNLALCALALTTSVGKDMTARRILKDEWTAVWRELKGSFS